MKSDTPHVSQLIATTGYFRAWLKEKVNHEPNAYIGKAVATNACPITYWLCEVLNITHGHVYAQHNNVAIIGHPTPYNLCNQLQLFIRTIDEESISTITPTYAYAVLCRVDPQGNYAWQNTRGAYNPDNRPPYD